MDTVLESSPIRPAKCGTTWFNYRKLSFTQILENREFISLFEKNYLTISLLEIEASYVSSTVFRPITIGYVQFLKEVRYDKFTKID